MSTKLWDKGFNINQKIEKFTIGKDRELDLLLAPYDVEGSIAHAKMLEKIGLLKTDELEQLLDGLEEIKYSIEKGKFEIEEGIEDVHSQIELLLTRKLGDIGKKIHSGRSRNDQVLLDLKLFYRSELKSIFQAVEVLVELLLNQSEDHKEDLMPGYTHMQVAMPSSFGLWFGAYAETLIDDLHILTTTINLVNQNPLGSAAGYGSSFPLDRTYTTKLLKFNDLSYNVIHAQLGRGKTEQYIAFAFSALAHTLAKFCMEICLYNGQDYNFFSLPDEYTTGSSIMPHKKNPDVFELLRANYNHISTLPTQIQSLLTNLPSGYHRDLQLLKEILFPMIMKFKECLEITTDVIPKVRVTKNLLEKEKYRMLFSVEKVNELVLQGVPFRDAYKMVGANLDNINSSNVELKHTHEGSLGNLNTENIRAKLRTVKGNLL